MRNYSIFMLCLVIGAALARECTRDYECGIPYGYCEDGGDDCYASVSGLAIDEAKGDVYFMQICRSESPYGNITLKRVSADGGTAESLQTRFQFPAPGNPIIVLDFVDNLVFYGKSFRQPTNTISTINVLTLEDTQGIPTGGLSSQNSFDVAGNAASYTCNFVIDNGSSNNTILRIPGVAGQLGAGQPQVFYKLAGFDSCGPLRAPATSPYLYFVEREFSTDVTVVRSNFLRFRTDCNPAAGTCNPELLFVVDQAVNDFDVFNDATIVFGTSSGLYKRDISGAAATTLLSGVVTGVRVYNNKIYFNDGVNIQSIPFSGGNVQQVNGAPRAQCQCLDGFYGASCTSCDGQVQWKFGKPSCVPLVNGVPQACSEAWQCGNVPYVTCSGSCQCVSNFTGLPSCTTCAPPKTVSWTSAGPVCE